MANWLSEESEYIQKNGWKRKFFNVNGVKIHCVIADTAPKNSPLMILLHGFPEFWYSWRLVMPELSKHYHVVVPDQRGYNLSSKPNRVSKYYLKELAIDIIEILKHESYDYYVTTCHMDSTHEFVIKPRAIVVGHDWGGGLAWQITRWYPQFVKKLVIINCPPADILLEEALKNINQLKKSYYVFAFQIPFVAEQFFAKFKFFIFNDIAKKGSKDEQSRIKDRNAYLAAFSYKNFAAGINWYRAALRYSIFDKLGKPMFKTERKIQIETKVIWGTADLALDINLTRHFPKVVNPKKLSVVFLPGVSHWVPQETPQATVEEILKFLKKDSGAKNIK
jgi:pimeloyl-ACP methyl ester carboxylesterase